MSAPIAVVPRRPADSPWIRETFVREWHDDRVVLADGRTVRADTVPALVAWRDTERAGLLAYRVSGSTCEIVALVARPTREGVGTALLEALAEVARSAGCDRIEVSTTNDNLDALRFYQRRGFELIELHRNAMDAVRARKPDVPIVGEYGIPLRDMLVLMKRVG